MTVRELRESTYSTIEVLDSHSGRVLCHNYKEEKHDRFADKEVISIWAKIKTETDESVARAILSIYVNRKEGET